jgi:hypothetical protein
MHKPTFALLRYLRLSALVVMSLLLPACDSLPSSATPTSIAGTPTVERAATRPEPVSQGWIFTLPVLRQENHFNLDLDVVATGGIPIGTISMGRGRNYEHQGNPDLMSTVTITANGKLLLEIAASDPANKPGENSNIAVAAKGQSYEKTTVEGWHVRTTVKQLAVTQHPKLADGTQAADPVFQTLDMDVEVVGNSATPYLGLIADNVTAARAALENLRDANLQLIEHGVIIREVTPGGPADKAGLRPGDIILAINSKKIDEYNPLTVPLSRLHAGDKVTLDVVRDGKNLAVEATLGRRP